jgi:hypothetical protein
VIVFGVSKNATLSQREYASAADWTVNDGFFGIVSRRERTILENTE